MRAKYLKPEQFKNPMEYVATKLMQIACDDYRDWTKARLKVLGEIREGKDVKKNEKRLKTLDDKLKDLTDFFMSEESGVYGALNVDGEAILQWLNASIGQEVMDDSEIITIATPESDVVEETTTLEEIAEATTSTVDTETVEAESEKEIVLPYKIVEVTRGQYRFVFE